MRPLRIREKSQITLPSQLVKALGLKKDDLLNVQLEGDRIILSRPGSADAEPKGLMQFWGVGRQSPARSAAQIDAEIQALRAEWKR